MSDVRNVPYELSIWDDVVESGNTYYSEKKIAVIGADNMDSAIRATNLKLVSNVNGSNTLTFNMCYKFLNEENKLEDNPFIPYMVNERKLKLKYKNKWYDLKIKNIVEESSKYIFSYTATDSYINELSKNGFNLEFAQDLNNNQGTACELGQKVLEGTDWQLVDNNMLVDGTHYVRQAPGVPLVNDTGEAIISDCIIQETIESLVPMYPVGGSATFYAKKILINDTQGVTYATEEEVIIPSSLNQIFVYVPYTHATERTDKVQFIYNGAQGVYEVDNERVILNAQNYFIMEPTYIAYGNGFDITFTDSHGTTVTLRPAVYGGTSIKVSDEYRGKRFVIPPKTKFDPLTKKYVSIYRKEIEGVLNNKDTYVYEDTEYIVPNILQNYVSNHEKFKSTAGWRTVKTIEGASNMGLVENVSDPDLFAFFSNSTSQATPDLASLLRIKFDGTGTCLVNSGPYDTRASIKSYTKGEKYVLYIDSSNLLNSPYDYSTYGAKYVNGNPFASLTTELAVYSIRSDGSINITDVLARFETFVVNGTYLYSVGTILNDYSEASTKSLRVGLFFAINTSSTKYWYIKDAQLFKYYDYNGRPLLPSDEDADFDTKIVTKYYGYTPEDNTTAIEEQDTEKIIFDFADVDTIPSDYALQEISNGEKITEITAKESNFFNIIQNICERFECWARFDILHDADGKVQTEVWEGHVRQKKYVTFHKYIGQDNYAGFRYGVNLNSIQRTLDSKSIVSKLIVKNNNNKYATNGFCTIQRAASNPTKQNSIYNFDNYINQGLLSAEQVERDFWYPSATTLGYLSIVSTAAKQYDELADKIENINEVLYPLESNYEVAKNGVDSGGEKIQELNERIFNEFQCHYEDFTKGMGASLASMQTNNDYGYCIAWALYNDTPINHVSFGTINSAGTLYSKNLRGALAEMNELKTQYNKALTDKTSLETQISNYKDKIEEYKATQEVLVETIRNADKAFYQKYNAYIQEGTWIDEKYLDDEKYYLDAVSTLYNSCFPKVSYNISVVDVSPFEGGEGYFARLGDKTYIEDVEYFGYELKNGIKTPYKEDIVITEITYILDNESRNTIKVQNYKNQFQDLFHRLTATVQSVNYSSGAYQRAAEAIKADQTIDTAYLQDSFNQNAIAIRNAKNQTITIDELGITATSADTPNYVLRIINGGLFVSKNGGETWETGVSGEGINANMLTAGQINTSIIQVMDGDCPAFRWDSRGINAYDYDLINDHATNFNYTKGVRYDRFGIYGFDGLVISGPNAFNPTSVDDIIGSTGVKFALTWKGFSFKHGDGTSSIVLGQYDKLVSGSTVTTYGLKITSNGTDTVEINERGDASFSGSVTALSGNIAGWVIGTDSLSKTYNIDGHIYSNSLNTNSSNNAINIATDGTVTFAVNYAGEMTATAGTIGGWTISASGLDHTGVGMSPTGTNAFYAGSKFAVAQDGTLTATGATIAGALTASSGQIGNWLISDGGLKSANDEIQFLPVTSGAAIKVGNKFTVNADGTLSATGASFSGSISGSTITGGSININNKFKVSNGGAINAVAGSIGGWNISVTGLSAGSLSLVGGLAPKIKAVGLTGSIIVLQGFSGRVEIGGDGLTVTNAFGHGYRYTADGPIQI